MSSLSLDQAFSIALQHHQARRFQQAEDLYRQILAEQPRHHDALHLLGVIASQQNQPARAADLIRQAVALYPNFPQAHSNLGKIFRDLNQPELAVASCQKALALNRNFPEALCNLGNALTDLARTDEAIATYRQAIALKPDYSEAHSNLGNALRLKRQLPESLAACQHALTLNPNAPEYHNNLGNSLRDSSLAEEAAAAFRRSIALNPNLPESHFNLANALKDQDLLAESAAAYRQAIALNPRYAEAHHNLSFLLLSQGDFTQGWEEYEWRSRCKEFASLRRNFSQPQWDGSPLHGKTILLHAEQGFGDTLQFIRYLPQVIERGGRPIVECQPQLQRLVAMLAHPHPVISGGKPLPHFDVHCSLLSLPKIFQTTLATIPHSVPYLHPAAVEIERWGKRLPATFAFKVGLSWLGNPAHANDRQRSIHLSQFAPLAAVPDIQFYSLQKFASSKAEPPPAWLQFIDFMPEVSDFADTAGLIANLDLVISVDTSVAHLAGALGKPTWLLLPHNPDWRWMLGRSDSPWYPTMRLFRQSVPGDWGAVIQRVGDTLGDLVQDSRTRFNGAAI